MARPPNCDCGECCNCVRRANSHAIARGDLDAVRTVPSYPPEAPSRLVKLAPGPYVSRGGFLNYEHWWDRDRFVELDLLIHHKKLPPNVLRARNLRILGALDSGLQADVVAKREQVTPEVVRKVVQFRERWQPRTMAAAA